MAILDAQLSAIQFCSYTVRRIYAVRSAFLRSDTLRVFYSDGAGLVTEGWLPEPPAYSAEYKTPNESFPPYTTQYATPYNYGGQHQNVVIVQPQVTCLPALAAPSSTSLSSL